VTRGKARRPAFGVRLLIIVLAGAAARVLYDLLVLREIPLGLDSTWYYLEAGVIRHEHAYAEPAIFAVDRTATAAWPPLYPSFLSVVQTVAGDSVRASQMAGVLCGSATVALTGLVARRVAGATVGLLAAGLAAISPLLIAADGSVMSETLFLPLALATMLTAFTARDRGRWVWWVASGTLAGLATLTRAEGLLLVPCVVVPVALGANSSRSRREMLSVALVAVTMVVVLVPWCVRNWIRVDEPVIANVSSATAIAGANCGETYGGDDLGSWAFSCIRDDLRAQLDEAEWTSRVRRQGLEYASDHVSRVPVVAAARVARLWSLWDPSDQIARESLETRNRRWQWLVAGTGLVTLAAGLTGLVLLGRQGRPIGGLIGLIVMATLVALLTYGNTRFRTTAEPALLIGAAALLVTISRSATRDLTRARHRG
jgi:4-amino-4-deoxy-L-arabinose transferase-like glycosyltransferase